jgi:hypothetical protein
VAGVRDAAGLFAHAGDEVAELPVVHMEFRQVTKRGGFGEGIFLGSY